MWVCFDMFGSDIASLFCMHRAFAALLQLLGLTWPQCLFSTASVIMRQCYRGIVLPENAAWSSFHFARYKDAPFR
ncbi:hypothetical protein BGZ60DRAFT_401078 [Tricladium varicosporioides]|nr:hypothetical protein BGZ60DRAFT_401078 [Hymenoscyphus varicosporioides]